MPEAPKLVPKASVRPSGLKPIAVKAPPSSRATVRSGRRLFESKSLIAPAMVYDGQAGDSEAAIVRPSGLNAIPHIHGMLAFVARMRPLLASSTAIPGHPPTASRRPSGLRAT